MKIKTEDIYRVSLFVPILFFVREYYYVFSELLSGNAIRSILSGSGDWSLLLSIPLLAYLLTAAFLLFLSRSKQSGQIFKIFVFAPMVHGVFVIVFFVLFSLLTVTGVLPLEGTMFSVLVAIVAAIVVIPIGYIIMGFVALIFVIIKKIGLIDEQIQTS